MRKIIICEKCEGAGKIKARVDAYDEETSVCAECQGHGRLIEIKTIERIPYVPEEL
jgi:DnaJ-class molecular chaperone